MKGLIKGDTRSLDDGPHAFCMLHVVHPKPYSDVTEITFELCQGHLCPMMTAENLCRNSV